MRDMEILAPTERQIFTARDVEHSNHFPMSIELPETDQLQKNNSSVDFQSSFLQNANTVREKMGAKNSFLNTPMQLFRTRNSNRSAAKSFNGSPIPCHTYPNSAKAVL
jgi:hypothetical protein